MSVILSGIATIMDAIASLTVVPPIISAFIVAMPHLSFAIGFSVWMGVATLIVKWIFR